MKVLNLNCDYIWTTLHQLMKNELELNGIKCSVFSPVCSKNNSVIKIEDEIVCQCFKKYDRYFFYVKQLKIIKAIEKKLDVKNYDLIHAFYLFTDGNYARFLSKKYNIPYVVAVRNTDVNTFFKKRPYLRGRGIRILRDAKKIFFLSETYREFVINKYVPMKFRNEIEKKTIIIPNGIDNYWHSHLFLERNYIDIAERINQKRIKLIYAGSIDKNKNIGATIEAIIYLEKKGWDIQFEIVGKVIELSEYNKYKNYSFISFVDKLPKERLMEKYRNADIFVMPSHKETFGLVYVEAMTQGLPIIYTRGQGFDKQFSDGKVGFSVLDFDPITIADAIEKICLNYFNISRNCMEGATKFVWSNICNKYIDIYNEILIEGGTK